LRLRAEVLAALRQFFAERQVMEVETPQLAQTAALEPHLTAIIALYKEIGDHPDLPMYLQTSTEFAMKRLLAAGCGLRAAGCGLRADLPNLSCFSKW
jgi:lysyl-tRNA synthetase class 2